MYIVWRRNDGYVAATVGMPDDYVTGGSDPLPGTRERIGSGIPVTFEKLGEFVDWNSAYNMIVTERAKILRNSS
jgi:hypothetical protein